jgi:AcrR family transcriptional regulator
VAGDAGRPAHRPSRKVALVEAAIHLFTTRPVEQVSAADIAHEAGMTSAALYYHYRSKDELLVESIRSYGEEIVRRIKDEHRRHRDEADGLRSVVRGVLLRVLVEDAAASHLYFVTASGLNLQVENLRREQRGEMVTTMRKVVRHHLPTMSAPEAGVVAAAVVSLVEVAASLSVDDHSVGAEDLAELGADLALVAAGIDRDASRMAG